MGAVSMIGLGYCGIDLECKLMTSSIDSDERIQYTGYGIRITDKSGRTVLSLPDISSNRETVESFAKVCVGCGVSALHIKDVLEDYLL